jgi:uncharacterized membrane protein (UPF0136 family)
MKNAFALKIVLAVLCLVMLALQLRSMSGWTETRGVFDDICYLRQAHLFQRFGLAGFDTDMSRDDDGYARSKFREIGFPGWKDRKELPCHNTFPATGKVVIQYPPGPGMVLALFPKGHQVVPMFWFSTIAVFAFACLAILRARKPASMVLAGLFGCLAIYLMINPIKASYSMAPTAVVCAVCGYLTARCFGAPEGDQRLAPLLMLGVLFGLAVNFRLANIFLCGGCSLFLLIDFLKSRQTRQFLRGLWFALALAVGMLPTLVSYWINTGSPFTSTYTGATDVQPLDFSLTAIMGYLGDYLQVALLAFAIAGAIRLWLTHDQGLKRIARLTALNLAINLAFFLTYPIATPYYTIPIALLSLWTLLFAVVEQEAQSDFVGQGAVAGNRL